MKIPKSIRKKFEQRAKYGDKVRKLDAEIAEFISSKGVDPCMLFESPLEINSIMLLTEPHTLSKEQLSILEDYE